MSNHTDTDKKKMTIAEAIGVIFRRSGLSQRKIGEILGVSHVHVCNIQQGHAGFSIELLANIKDKFGYDPYILAAVANGEVSSLDYEYLLEEDTERK